MVANRRFQENTHQEMHRALLGTVVKPSAVHVHTHCMGCDSGFILAKTYMHHRKGLGLRFCSFPFVELCKQEAKRSSYLEVQAVELPQENVRKMNDLSLTWCRISLALLHLLKEFPSSPEVPVLPGQALTFVAPDGTANNCVWIQVIKTTEKHYDMQQSILSRSRRKNAMA